MGRIFRKNSFRKILIMSNNNTYLGDGVYAVFDGFGIELRATNYENPTDIIYLEPLVLKSLISFYEEYYDE